MNSRERRQVRERLKTVLEYSLPQAMRETWATDAGWNALIRITQDRVLYELVDDLMVVVEEIVGNRSETALDLGLRLGNELMAVSESEYSL